VIGVVTVLKLSVELSHLKIAPTCPASVKTPLVLPEQMVEPPETEPPTVVGSTTMVVGAEYDGTPELSVTALYSQTPTEEGTSE
jgi:hypothetical protein